MYEAVTNGVAVRVSPQFMPSESSEDDSRFFWAYTVEIENQRQDTVQLRTRFWRITDALGRVETVRGPGVVGETPRIAPGDTYTYTSGCPLTTPSGIMMGSYGMVDGSGAAFEVEIPAFSLDCPEISRTVN